MPAALMTLEGLDVRLPGGEAILEDLSLTVAAGEIVAILGASGAGKSTLLRALFEPDVLGRLGFSLSAEKLEMTPAALVPQQGAVLDHLSVRGNVQLARRWQGVENDPPEAWLERVGLGKLARRPVAGLSGGQRQRLAVARALAAGRQLLFLDEPSAGLDAHSVHEIASLLKEQARDAGVGIVLVTHDPTLVALAADRALFLDPAKKKFEVMPHETSEEDEHGFEHRLRERLAEASGDRGGSSRRRPLKALAADLWQRSFASLEVPLLALAPLLRTPPRQWADLIRVALRVGRQAISRPAPFYAVVSTLLGFTILYVLVRAAPAGLSTKKLLEMVGGLYILALAPPLSALLFVATSGAAVSAWLGSLQLGKQVSALSALGITRERYLFLPGFLTMVLGFALCAALISGGLALGGAILHVMEGASSEVWPALWRILGDLLDPLPERARLQARAVWLLALYAPGIAADVIARGSDLKERSDDVTRAMTGSVVACTLWVVVLELGSALILFAEGGADF
ncbi:MAG: ATP-binding cassette domain-containing protein [Deltaproteobacteria bacterium]|nr:ATP-binding cassette domain-containing protein [Deltaproteobacteria bacterium]